MAAFVIPSIFTAKDSLSSVVRHMAAGLQSFAVKAEASGSRAERAFHKIGTSAQSAYDKINIFPRLNSVLGAAGLTVGIAGITMGVKKFIDEASKVEDAQASFQSLLGSLDKAKGLVSDLYKMGASTPFEFSDLASAAKMMIGFGVATKDTVLPQLSMLGDLAQGNAEKLGGITLAFSQIQAAGKANLGDINQLINNGVPILGQLAKQWHMTVGAAREAAGKGKATGAEITKAFKAMTSEGGMFFNGMAIASGTFSGKVSTMKDSINQAFASIGNVVLPIAKDYVEKISLATTRVQAWADQHKDLIKAKVSEWVQKIGNGIQWLIRNFSTIVKWTKIYIGVLIALKAISIATAIATTGVTIAQTAMSIAMGVSAAATGAMSLSMKGNAIALGTYKVVTMAAAGATKVWAGVQWLLNAALTANPIGLIIVGIAALIAIIVVVVKHTKGWGEQWSATTKWIGDVFRALKAEIQYGWLQIQDSFHTMVESIVKGWYWFQHKIGAMGDETYKKNLQQIESEKKARMAAIDSVYAKMKAAQVTAMQGPGWHMSWDSSEEAKKGESKQAVNTKGGAQAAQNNTTTSIQKQQAEIIIKDETGRAALGKNTGGVPIRIGSTLAQFGANVIRKNG